MAENYWNPLLLKADFSLLNKILIILYIFFNIIIIFFLDKKYVIKKFKFYIKNLKIN